MSTNPYLKSRNLDDYDRKILMKLQEDGRMPLKDVAKAVSLSVDSIHKRIKELKRKEILSITTTVDLEKVGFQYTTDNKVKLRAASDEEKQAFIKYLVNHPRCIDLLELIGTFDFSCNLVAHDSEDLVNTTNEIKHKFRDIIDKWDSFLVIKTYKFDQYSL